MVVDYLIKKGADVNAPRLPRRYASETHGHGIGPTARRKEGLALGASGEPSLTVHLFEYFTYSWRKVQHLCISPLRTAI